MNLNIKNRYDQTPMHLAAQKWLKKIIKPLVGKGWLFQIQHLSIELLTMLIWLIIEGNDSK